MTVNAKWTPGEEPTLANVGPAVTGWHLALTSLEAATTEFEWAMLRWHEAFDRYNRQALNMLGLATVSIPEMSILHIVRLHDRAKPASMIANLLNRDDVQNIQYSLRKLMGLKLIQKAKDGSGKNSNVEVTDKGRQVCDEVASIRRQLLIQQIGQLENGEARLLFAAKTVSMLIGLYDEAGRVSTGYMALDTSSDE
jgi:predicted MarR family transcription regulator